MKKFDEWFEEKYADIHHIPVMKELFKELARESWQAAQEAQRESDAEVFMNNYSDDNATGADIYLAIRNNKT